MEATLAELLFVAAVVFLGYRLLRPVRRRIEDAILRILDPKRKLIIDVKASEEPKQKKKE